MLLSYNRTFQKFTYLLPIVAVEDEKVVLLLFTFFRVNFINLTRI